MLTADAASRASKAKAVAEEEMRKTIMILVGDIVHDLRTPITAIKTTVDFLHRILPQLIELAKESKSSSNLLSENSWDYLQSLAPITDIQESVKMMTDFISTTLTELASANKAVSSELTKEQLTQNSSYRIIENSINAYPFTALEKNTVTAYVNYDFAFMGNSILSMKILFNLIKNALEQIALNGSGKIIISTRKEEHFNIISIKDTAGGAPAEYISQFFNGYFTTKTNGTGIGLAFCKKTMLSFGGDIQCLSVEGESMEFILKFPSLI